MLFSLLNSRVAGPKFTKVTHDVAISLPVNLLKSELQYSTPFGMYAENSSMKAVVGAQYNVVPQSVVLCSNARCCYGAMWHRNSAAMHRNGA